MGLDRAAKFFGRDGVDGIEVRLANLDQTEAVTEKLRGEFTKSYRINNWMDFNAAAAAGFQLLKEVYSLVLTILIGVAAFNLVATLIMVVMEKRKDIAVLMAMGASRADIRRIFRNQGDDRRDRRHRGGPGLGRNRMLHPLALPFHPHSEADLWYRDFTDRRSAAQLPHRRGRIPAVVLDCDSLPSPSSGSRNAGGSLSFVSRQATQIDAIIADPRPQRSTFWEGYRPTTFSAELNK